MIKIAICDDDNSAINELERMLVDISLSRGIHIDIDSFSDGSKLIDYIDTNGQGYDIIFLDIEMKGMDGLDTGLKIRKYDELVYIIYVTGYENYAIEAYDVHPFQFVVKPVDSHLIEKYFMAIYEKIISGEYFFNFKFQKSFYKVPVKDIVYFDSKMRVVNIHMADGTKYTYYDKLNDVEKRLTNCKLDFWRIHQSVLINQRYIRYKTFDSITLIDGRKYYISEDRRKQISELYIKSIGDK